MVKEHTFPPMEECKWMWGNGRMVKLNGQGTSISQMEECMKGNSRMGYQMVKEHTFPRWNKVCRGMEGW